MTLAAVTAAALRAAAVHAGQRREGGDVPYVNHVLEVAALVAAHGGAEAEVAAALLHDVVEDSDATVAELGAAFGPEVAALVGALTDDPAWTGLGWTEKKRRQAERLEGEPAGARRIKLADQTSNVRDIVRLHDAWTREEAEEYVAGAERIAATCRGVAPALDALFAEAAAAARRSFDPEGGAP